MKTILITVSETSIIRNVIRTDFLPKLCTKGDRVVLVMPPELAREYQSEFTTEQVFVESMIPPLSGKCEKILAFFARNGFRTGTNRIMQHRAYANGESRIPVWVKEVLGALISCVWPLRALIRTLELRFTPSPQVMSLFERYNPDLVFSTILVNAAMDVPIVREAKRRDIRVVGMVRGWDNLTTYGILRVLPDRYFAHNEFLKEQAVQRHDMAEATVTIVGTPDFDKYAQPEFNRTREEYCAALGVDPTKQIILYAAIGDFLFPQEGEVATVFEELIESKCITRDAVVIFRAHPAFTSPLERMQGMHHVIADRAADYRSDNLQHWDMRSLNTVHLINSIRHAAVVVSPGSTMLIESALCDRPTIALGFDAELRRWFSAARWCDTATHIRDLLRTGGARVVWNKKELAEVVSEYIMHPEIDGENRVLLVERFAGPNRGTSAIVLAQQLLNELKIIGNRSEAR